MANLFDQLTFNTLRNNQLPNNQNTNQYQRYQNYDDAQEYDENYNENFGKSFAGIGRFDPSNMMLPSNLSQDLGASNYQDLGNSTVIDESRIPGRIQKELPTNLGIMQNFKNKFTTPTMAFMKMMAGERSPQKQAAYDAITGGRSFGTGQGTIGMYGGNEYELYNSPSGLKVGSDILGYGEGYEKNFDSMFGSKSLEEMEEKKLDWARNRLAKGKAISQRLQEQLNIANAAAGADKVTPAQTDRQKIEAYTGRGMSDYRASRPASERSFTGHGRSGMGRDPSDRMAQGGRAGYREAGPVEEEDIDVFEFMKDQGIPSGEMASDENNTILLEQLYNQFIDEGYSPADAEKMAIKEFQLMSQSQDQGIASIV